MLLFLSYPVDVLAVSSRTCMYFLPNKFFAILYRKSEKLGTNIMFNFFGISSMKVEARV